MKDFNMRAYIDVINESNKHLVERRTHDHETNHRLSEHSADSDMGDDAQEILTFLDDLANFGDERAAELAGKMDAIYDFVTKDEMSEGIDLAPSFSTELMKKIRQPGELHDRLGHPGHNHNHDHDPKPGDGLPPRRPRPNDDDGLPPRRPRPNDDDGTSHRPIQEPAWDVPNSKWGHYLPDPSDGNQYRPDPKPFDTNTPIGLPTPDFKQKKK